MRTFKGIILIISFASIGLNVYAESPIKKDDAKVVTITSSDNNTKPDSLKPINLYNNLSPKIAKPDSIIKKVIPSPAIGPWFFITEAYNYL